MDVSVAVPAKEMARVWALVPVVWIWIWPLITYAVLAIRVKVSSPVSNIGFSLLSFAPVKLADENATRNGLPIRSQTGQPAPAQCRRPRKGPDSCHTRCPAIRRGTFRQTFPYIA